MTEGEVQGVAEGGGIWDAGGKVEPEGRFLRRLFKNASHCATDQSLQISQVTSAVHFTPLHLAHVGCGSLNMGDMNAPNLRPPIPGQSRWSYDTDITLNNLKTEQGWNT